MMTSGPPLHPCTRSGLPQACTIPRSGGALCHAAGAGPERSALTEILEGWARSRGKHEVMKALASRGVVCGAVLDTAEVLANPHLRERVVVYDIDLDQPRRLQRRGGAARACGDVR